MTIRGSADIRLRLSASARQATAELEHLREAPRAELQELQPPNRHLASIAFLVHHVDLENVVAAQPGDDREEQRRRERAVRECTGRACFQIERRNSLYGTFASWSWTPNSTCDGSRITLRQVQAQRRIVAPAAHAKHRVAAARASRPTPRRNRRAGSGGRCRSERRTRRAPPQPGHQRAAVAAVGLVNHADARILRGDLVEQRAGRDRASRR